MPVVLVSDTSVLVDLHHGGLLEIALRLPYDLRCRTCCSSVS
jgi:hypothetical protein